MSERLIDGGETPDYAFRKIFASRKPVVSEHTSRSVSELLIRWKDGDQEALSALLPLVYQELRRMAQRYLRSERHNHTLQSTALVHEAYLRFAAEGPGGIENRAHFFAIASNVMRQILVDYARRRRAAKRGGGCKITLDESFAPQPGRDVNLIALDDALNGLAQLDEQQARIVEFRFFGGLSIEETSEVLRVSPTTVKREWATARAWLQREMERAPRI